MNFELLPIAFRMFPKREEKKEKNQKKSFEIKSSCLTSDEGCKQTIFLVHG